jgi:hypothetical protein
METMNLAIVDGPHGKSNVQISGLRVSGYRDVVVAIACLLVLYAILFLVVAGLIDLTFR